MEAALSTLEQQEDKDSKPTTLSADARKGIKRFTSGFQKDLSHLGLVSSFATVGKLRRLGEREDATYKDLVTLLKELQGRIVDETDGVIFLTIDPSNNAYYLTPNLFGERVAESFPSAIVDIEEAGKCLALGRNTASVFHLMRALEAGLRALGTSLGDPSLDANANPTWDRILKRGDAEFQKSAANRSPEWQSKGEFFSDAIANLRAVKTAWRNPTMHVIGVYDPEKALDVFNAVKGFMRHLAAELHESPTAGESEPVTLCDETPT
jgi:hypothetical protein